MYHYDIYYQKNGRYYQNDQIKIRHIMDFDRYAFVWQIQSKKELDLDDIFTKMQGENWSPHGERRDIISILGLSHTSMSVNDVIHDKDNHKFYQVCEFGFKEIEK